MVEVSIIIVSWNTEKILKKCLESIYQQTKGLSFEIIVVDNASTDGSVKMLRRDFPQVRLFQNKENFGFARANNLGMREAKGTYFFLLNSDTLLQNNASLILKKFFETHPRAGALGAHLFNEDSTLQINCSIRPNLPHAFLNLILQQPTYGYPPRQYDQVSFPVETITGAALMIHREVFEKVGGFDEVFFMYSEDVDWSTRIGEAGYELWFVNEARVIHLGGKSSAQDQIRTKKDFNQSLVRYYGKYHNVFETALYRFFVWFGANFGPGVLEIRHFLKKVKQLV